MSTIRWAFLMLPLDKLLLPAQSRIRLGLIGTPPCWTRQSTCSVRSPPMPRFSQVSKFFWRIEENRGRERRSKCESPIRESIGCGFEHRRVCLSYLSPHVIFGFDLLVWENSLGASMKDMEKGIVSPVLKGHTLMMKAVCEAVQALVERCQWCFSSQGCFASQVLSVGFDDWLFFSSRFSSSEKLILILRYLINL